MTQIKAAERVQQTNFFGDLKVSTDLCHTTNHVHSGIALLMHVQYNSGQGSGDIYAWEVRIKYPTR